jgi:hypothetical protein
MFIKLLAIRIVANNFLGLSNKLMIICSCLDTLPSFTSKSDGFNENKATSDPEIRAEAMRSMKKNVILTTSIISIAEKKMRLEGPGSKIELIFV